MSGPSSEGRLSVSSEPSATSSRTLNSTYSGTHGDNGEGSAAHRPNLPTPRHNGGGIHVSTDAGNRASQSTLASRRENEHDFARRRQRNRRSGGFLLDSAFPAGPRSRQAPQKATEGEHPTGQEALPRDGLRIPKTRNSMRESLTARVIPEPDQSEPDQSEPGPRPMIDPNQIVHMALNLSESRRRNISQLSMSSGSKRVGPSAQRDASLRDSTGGSLRQYLNEQRRASRNISPVGGRSSPSASRHVSVPMRSASMSYTGQPPSPATLARRDKARAFIELRVEYLRLLDVLPPLKPDSSAPGNFIISASNMPGSPHVHITRVASYAGHKHELGRAYNPLQCIRNRKTRARERKCLDHPPDEFSDPDQVRSWVDRVENESKVQAYRQQDGVVLPKYHEDHIGEVAPATPARPRMGWVFTSEELLADAHWLEQGDNKILIEDRHGHKLFPVQQPKPQDLLDPRSSKEYPDKRRKSWAESLPRLSGEILTGDESENGSDRGRKRRLLPAFRSESPRLKAHGWRKSRHHSKDADVSDSDSASSTKQIRVSMDADNGTGPLALRMKELIEQEARSKQSVSPDLPTPDTPDKWGVGKHEAPPSEPARNSVESTRLPNGSVETEPRTSLRLPLKSRRNNLSVDEPRSSFEDLDSTAPNTPLHPKRFHIGSDLSPPPSRDRSTSRKPKKGRFDIFRSDESTKSHKHDTDSAGTDRKQGSRVPSEEVPDSGGLGNAILGAPSAVKSLLTHRKNESVSSLPSPEILHGKETKEIKEPSSAVTRFFKGVKHESSKVGGLVFKKDRLVEDDKDSILSPHSAANSDIEEVSAMPAGWSRPNLVRSPTSSSATSKLDRYHLDLPSFRSTQQNNDDKGIVTDSKVSDNHNERQALVRADSRSARFEKLAPPRLNTRSISAVSQEAHRHRSSSPGRERLAKSLARAGGVGAGGFLPITSLAHPERRRSGSRPTLDGKRHWSITDENGNTLYRPLAVNAITQADIARVRALFLCSGVKAQEIDRRAHLKREEPPAFLLRAAQVANAELIPIPKKEEHVLAARILTQNLEGLTQAMHDSATEFRESTAKELSNMISSLKSRVESDLFPRLRSCGDEAVRITNEISGNAPLSVKQISDDIDKMIRMRRRRMRWVRRVGWMLKCFGSLMDGIFKPRGSSSLAAVVAAFLPTFLTAMLFVCVFAAIRHRYPKIYSPRTYLGTIPEKDRTPAQSRSYWDWIHSLRTIPDKFTLYHESLDSYLYLRFLRTIIFICVVGCCITWPILMPINATGGGRSGQLDKISIGNVKDKKHLYAHAVVAWVFFAFVMFTVARERLWLIGLRQAWNLSKPNAKRLSSRTVLFLCAPKGALDGQGIHRHFGDDAVRMWPATKAEKLESLVSARNSLVEQLESAEMALIQRANKKAREGKQKLSDQNGSRPTYDGLPDNLKKGLRPTHRSMTAPVGKQVDSIEVYRQQLLDKEAAIKTERESYQAPKSNGGAAVFVEFRTQAAAQKAFQQVSSSHVLALNPRYTGVLPKEVIWNNLTLPPARRISQESIAHALVIATIIFWSIPVSLVGALSNVTYLAENYKWLAFLNKLPDSVLGLLTGLVPPMLLSLLSKWVPNIFRYIFKSFGEPTNTSAELKVLKWFFVFQVLQVFLINTLSSGASALVSQIGTDPTSIPNLLAERLPRASNSYLTYFIVQGLTSSSDNLLNYSDLLSYLFFDTFFDKTPREKYNSHTSLKGIAWGKVFPKYTNFVIIALAYSCIAPLVMGFAAIGLILLYLSYRYMLLFTVQPKIDTKGHCYTLALQQILTGIYLAELCLIGLFSIRKATGPSVMMGILFVVTVLYNITMNRYLAPLEQFLPSDLVTSESGDVDGNEQTPLLASAEEGGADQHTGSHIHRIGAQAHLPSRVVDPIATFFEPHIYASHKAMLAWLKEGDFDDEVPEYEEEKLEKVYANPAFTSQTPVVWLARDGMGVSVKEVQENEKVGLRCEDRGAWVDEKGRVRWSVEDFGEVPVFREGIKW
ncbi:DUF221-domain-containing protein [Amniculicola lignicola CBS 123094]|uniref:DUF221-domain-containing protein n=1 Tax=Amniculicola lignicola CBS 123094 TaxID=1392246 RepID=A0A6A5WZU0_9PLEO|nr:DUF221-domain-containing protein [Amniculicola lignicola CBS 123094]